MKKISILGLILLGLGFSSLLVSADIIPVPNNYHRVSRCSKIVNLTDYSDITLLGTTDNTVGNPYPINNNECLISAASVDGGSIDIYWSDKEKINIVNKNNLIIRNFKFGDYYISDNNNIVEETIEYIVSKEINGKINLSMSKRISKYNDGKPNKIENFSNPEKDPVIKEIKKEVEPVVKKEIEKDKDVTFEGDDIVNLQQDMVKKGFWQKVKCFFRISKNC